MGNYIDQWKVYGHLPEEKEKDIEKLKQ